uniref:Uncharacterized protein n=1 Tax=Buteo japonicus TaxID=224669 RepID=A0A8C0B6T7_9AVES
MGLSSSKTHPKVTKVAPMRDREDLPALTTPYQLPDLKTPLINVIFHYFSFSEIKRVCSRVLE